MENTTNEILLSLHVKRLPEGVFLATSKDLPGLVAQGRTIEEAIEIARDVTRKLVESFREHGDPLPEGLKPVPMQCDVAAALGV